MAVRIGLGASRWHLIRQLLVESTLLAIAGGAAGIVLANWGMALTRRSLPPFILAHVPGLKHFEVDARVLWFTLGVALLTGILAGLAPALRFSRSELGDALKENTRAASASPKAGRLRAALVTTEVALALVLLVGAGLMVKGFNHLAQSEMGFDRAHVLALRVSLPEQRYQTKEQILNYYDRATRQLQSLPGVRSVACATTLPGNWSAHWSEYSAEGRPPAAPGEMPSTMSQVVTPDFFATLRVPLLKGRFLSAGDGRGAPPVAVISATMARYAWPGEDPIGKHLLLDPQDRSSQERLIVGVVGDVRFSPFQPTPDPATYIPLAQVAPASTAFVMRTENDPLTLVAAASTQIRTIDPDTPAYDVRSVEQILSDNVSGVEYSARMMLVFAGIALTLAAAGIFAVMAYLVAQRTHEIGVRMALGARPVDVLRLVVASAIRMAAIGLAIGICIAWLLTRAVSSALFGVVRIDAPIFVSLTLVLASIAALAAYIPARAATKVDPMAALRCE
jgi:putative ABC transport system permease protein